MNGDEAPSLGSLELKEALAKEGCPLCRLVREGEERWLWQFLYEFTGDPGVREELDRAFGLCHTHAHLLIKVVEERELVSGDSVARVYETIVRRYCRDLIGAASGGPRRPPRKAECPLCLRRRTRELGLVYSLLEALEDSAWRASFELSAGLCNPHFLLTVRKADDPQVKGFLIADHLARLEKLERALGELQRKQRYDVDEPITPEEARSWREAIWRFTGMEYDRPLIRRQG